MAKCVVCGVEANASCSGCHEVFYCGKPHQKQHWKQHKPSCVPYKIAENAELGRHLVACRNIRPGELIISEKPLVLGPKQFSDALCLGCFKPVSASSFRCKCGFPMCGVECASAASHKPECEATCNSGRQMEIDVSVSPNPFYQAVMLLRCLALRNNDKAWRQMEQLESHDEERKLSGRQSEIDDHVREYLGFLGVEVDPQLVYRICGVLDVNGFEAHLNNVMGLYPRAAMLENNCSPNTSRAFTDDLHLHVRASRLIPKDSHITTSYTDPFWGTSNRRYFLRQSKFFDCMCARCADPTEFGSELSSLRCPKCTQGLMRSSAPLDPAAAWHCSDPICDRQLTAKEVDEIIQYVGEKLVNVEKGSVAAAEKFVSAFDAILGPTHFYLCDIKTALCLLYGKENGEDAVLTNAEAERKQELATELLSVLGKVNPGQTRLRAILLYELQTAIMRKAQIDVQNGTLKPLEWRQKAQECLEYLQESAAVLQREPTLSSERMLAERAAGEHEALTKVLAVTGYQAVMAGNIL